MLGSLNAELVIVGQDFSARDREGPNREPDPRIPTNKNLLRLIAAAGIDPNHAYLTNAMLCLKPGKHLGAPVRAEWLYRPYGLVTDMGSQG